MSMTFTAQQRKDITRRQINIAQENAGYAAASSQLNAQQTALLNVDNANAAFYNPPYAQAALYETEGEQINGSISATYTNGTISPYVAGDMSTSANTPGAVGATFFPSTYSGLVPDPIPAINGIAHPTGTDARYEGNIITNSLINQGLSQSINLIENGITGTATASTTTTGSIAGGVIVSATVTVASILNFHANDYLYINQSSHSGVYQIISVGVGSLTIKSVFPSASGFTTGAAVNNTVVGFSEGERESLVSVSYQEILTNVSTAISGFVTEWYGKVNNQITALTAQQETRSTQMTQNAAALSADNTALSTINAWIALPNTGVSGKYASASLSPLITLISTREGFATGRITDITTALGSVVVTGNTFSGVAGSPYYERYKWLNNRINRISGSATRYFQANNGMGYLTTLSTNNDMLQTDYSAFFLTKAIAVLDGTNIIQLKDYSGINPGDSLTVLSETQPEITRGVVSLMGTNQLKLDQPIPNTYQITDIARVFKTL